jgi:SAM-dependent methyltransferase
VNPHPGPEAARAFFSRASLFLEKTRDPGGNMVDPVRRAEERAPEYETYVKTLLPLLPPRGTILDIGCGTGLMLSLLPDRLKKIACEPNPAAAALARKRGIEVREVFAEDLDFPRDDLVLVIFNQSLDHLIQPAPILEKAALRLAPGGLILASGLINPRSPAAILSGPNHRLWHPFHRVCPPFRAVVERFASLGLELVLHRRPFFRKKTEASVPYVAKALLTLAKNRISGAGAPSPPFPGNTITYLARKSLVPVPAKTEEIPFKPARAGGRVFPKPFSGRNLRDDNQPRKKH